jgi:hypothetical protein
MKKFFPSDIEDTNLQKLIRYESSLDPQTLDDLPFTYDEVNHVVKKLNDKKAPGLDAISANIIKNVHIPCPTLLLNIYNKCLELFIFPDLWKIAVVKIMPKKHSKETLTASAYRPICLLPVLGKISEKLIIDRIMYHMHSNNLLNRNQYGFTPHKSTEDSVLKVVEWSREVLRSKQLGILISLDIAGAFDNAWWPKIMQQLNKKRCPRNLHKLVRNYFSRRKAQLTIGNSKIVKDLSKGCPQEKSCSPGLWMILYDILLCLQLPENCSIMAYADDALLLIKADTITGLENSANTALNSIYRKYTKEWCGFNSEHY